ncbi:MAG: superoxide dismutase [Bacilli bacterium]|jgi:Fe-Mn family superoxide dismutase|nr:superoxide dismutase [Bacilli bacterium]
MKYTLPNLPYSYSDLEPYIDAKTMTIHHTKHHQGYIDNLNATLDHYPELQKQPLEKLLTTLSTLPASIQNAVRNNGGGHFNHTLFWEIMTPKYLDPSPEMKKALISAFGSWENFQNQFATAAKTRFGSGWAWLIVNKNKELEIVSTPNQDTPLALGTPILGLDVWEHAYYLHYQNRRPDYIQAFFQLINWQEVEKRYLQAM